MRERRARTAVAWETGWRETCERDGVLREARRPPSSSSSTCPCPSVSPVPKVTRTVKLVGAIGRSDHENVTSTDVKELHACPFTATEEISAEGVPTEEK